MLITKQLRLREIVQTDGRKSGLTMWREWLQKGNSNKARSFSGNDCVMFVNVTRTFLRFISGFDRSGGTGYPSNPTLALTHAIIIVEVRLDEGEWSPLRLTDFAARKGIELVNLKSFAEHYEAEQKRRREARAERK